MALSEPRAIFGIHSFAPYRRTDGTPYGIAKVLGSSSLTLSGELVNLNGGSSKYSWAVEDGLVNAEISLVAREYPNFFYELFLGKAPTDAAAEASGAVTTLTNKNGTSLADATTGVASVSVKSGSEADVKFSAYVVKVVSATTVDVYALSDGDFAKGTDKEFEDDLLKITASPLTITTGAAVDIPGFGLELTGGSGTVAMTTDDTATFEARPENTGSTSVRIGGTSDVLPTFGAIVVAKKRGNFEMTEFDLFKVKGSGLPVGLTENAWSEASVTAQAFYDSDKNGVFDMRFVKANG